MTLSLVGLPMLNNFVGEFLILSGSMNSVFPHHLFWTVIATTGVILSAAYMLVAVQKTFYGELGFRPAELHPRDLGLREHLALWPLVALFLTLGLRSPFLMRAIDPVGTRIAATLHQPAATTVAPDSAGTRGFVDPALAAGALGKPAPPTNKGARY